MTRDRIQHALDIIYEKVFNLGQADLYPGLVSGRYLQHTRFSRMGSMPSWLHSSRPGAYPARSKRVAIDGDLAFVHVRYLDWGGRKPRVLTSSASTRTAKLSSTGTCCSPYQPPRTTPTRCSRNYKPLDFSGRILNSNRELPCGLRDIKKVRRSLPEPGFKGVTGRRAQPSAWTNSPKNSDGCRVPGTRSQERTIDCRGRI